LNAFTKYKLCLKSSRKLLVVAARDSVEEALKRGEIAAGDPDEKQNVLSSKPVDVLKNPNE
jgi:hypothetical protein